jgi:dihydroorotase-like cyclic amidohydrolase
MTTTEMFRLPGLVDIHVHLRDPGQMAKENFFTGTSAALAGGYTTVFDMPNNAQPIRTPKALEAKLQSAREQIVCDVGFYFGSVANNLDEFNKIRAQVWGLKLYGLSNETGDYNIPADILRDIYRAWNDPARPILLHAEADMIEEVMACVKETGQPTHICHVSSKDELRPILQAKAEGLPVTCGVTPHHLFLTDEAATRLGSYGGVKPELKPKSDVDYLWKHFAEIDVVESDHAPHTKSDKEAGAFGMPGLETTLPLLLQAEREAKLTRADIIQKCSTMPRLILGIPEDSDSYIDVEPVEFEISAKNMHSKSGWTPFEGRMGFGRVAAVTMRETLVYENGQVLARPGSGHII